MTLKTFIINSVLFFPRRINSYLIKPIKNIHRYFILRLDRKLLHKMTLNSFDLKKVSKIESVRLVKILRFAKKYSPYYKKIIPSINNKNCKEELERLPLLTRQKLMDYGNQIEVTNLWRIPHFELSTSGTTGIPLKFIRCPDYEWSHQMFLYEYMTGMAKIDLSKIISFGGKYLDEDILAKKIFWSNRSPNNIYGYYHFSSFYLNKTNLIYYIKKLEEIQPYIIRSYPSALMLFCDLCIEAGIKPKINIKGVYVTSESVTKDQMLKISNFFDCGVYGQYGHSEACVFGFTQKNDTKYYCSPLYGYTEVVDENGKPVKEGEIGQICVTSFTNRAEPFIRYTTGDLAEYGGRTNGFVIFNQLLGRSQDYILNSDQEKIYIIVGEFSECFLPAINNVKYWQAYQNEIGKMELKIVPKSNFSQNDENEIRQVMKNSKVEITRIDYVDDIPLTKAGKRKYVIREI